MSKYLWFDYGKKGVMKLFTKRRQEFTFQRDVEQFWATKKAHDEKCVGNRHSSELT